MAERFAGFDGTIWAKAKNARALAMFTLGGGNAEVGSKVLASGALRAPYERIVKGAIAASKRRRRTALKYLTQVDPMKIRGHLGALIALVSGVMMIEKKTAEAAQLLAMPGSLAPGTIIEDAALRRMLVAHSKVGTLEPFLHASRSYIRRFQKSVFGSSFDRLLGSQLLTFNAEELARHFGDIDQVLERLKPERRRKIYLTLSRGAVLTGKLDVAKFAADQARELSNEGTRAFSRVSLYQAGSTLFGENRGHATLLLSTVNVQALSKGDRALHAKVSRLAKSLTAWPPKDFDSPVAQPPPNADDGGSKALLDQAGQLFENIEALVSRYDQ